MRLRVLLLGLLLALPSPGARADVLVAVRPGVMCESAEALAHLTRPDGSSRSAMSSAEPRDLRIKAEGGCIDIPYGLRVEVKRAFHHTSTIIFDPRDGRGPREFTLPNIDFRPLPDTGYRFPLSDRAMAPPSEPDSMDFFFSALEQACPEKDWRGAGRAMLRGPLGAALADTPAPVAAENGAACAQGGPRCTTDETIVAMLRTGQLGRLLRAFCGAAPG